MNNLIPNLITAIMGVALILFVAAIPGIVIGTIVWLLWPYVIPDIFPGLVASGSIVQDIPWLASFLLFYITSMLFKATLSGNGKN